jgi:dipeptidase E
VIVKFDIIKKMKFLLTSAGIKNKHIAKALIELASKPAKEISFLFILTAANIEAGDKDWLIDNLMEFQDQGFKAIDIVDISAVPAENWKRRFVEADVICFGGGNEQHLAKVCNDLHMKEFLNALSDQKVYMGISAGSMVAGQFIPHELMKLVYPEEVYKELGKPLGFVDFCFIPHLNSEWFTHVRKANLESMKSRFNSPVYALDDETALKIEKNKAQIVGKGDFWVSHT